MIEYDNVKNLDGSIMWPINPQATMYRNNGYYRFCITNEWVHKKCAELYFGHNAVKKKEIHHRDGRKRNNQKDNLQPLTKEEHSALHREQWAEYDRYESDSDRHSTYNSCILCGQRTEEKHHRYCIHCYLNTEEGHQFRERVEERYRYD